MLDRFLGLEALALATIVERSTHGPALENLPDIHKFVTRFCIG
jgi:hypothetical protein